MGHSVSILSICISIHSTWLYLSPSYVIFLFFPLDFTSIQIISSLSLSLSLSHSHIHTHTLSFSLTLLTTKYMFWGWEGRGEWGGGEKRQDYYLKSDHASHIVVWDREVDLESWRERGGEGNGKEGEGKRGEAEEGERPENHIYDLLYFLSISIRVGLVKCYFTNT